MMKNTVIVCLCVSLSSFFNVLCMETDFFDQFLNSPMLNNIDLELFNTPNLNIDIDNQDTLRIQTLNVPEKNGFYHESKKDDDICEITKQEFKKTNNTYISVIENMNDLECFDAIKSLNAVNFLKNKDNNKQLMERFKRYFNENYFLFVKPDHLDAIKNIDEKQQKTISTITSQTTKIPYVVSKLNFIDCSNKYNQDIITRYKTTTTKKNKK